MKTALNVTLALWKREILKFTRDRAILIGSILQPIAFWLLLGLGFEHTFQMPGTQTEGVAYIEFLFPGIITLTILFTAVFSTITIVEERTSGFLQGVMVAPVGRTPIVLGIVMGGTTLAVGEAALFMALAPTAGITFTLTGVLLALLSAFLLAVSFTALGFVIAWSRDTTRGFHAIMNLLLFPMWILGGSVFPVDGASPVLQWMVHLNPVSYGVDAIRQSLYYPNEQVTHLQSLPVSMGIIALFAVAMIIYAGRKLSKASTPA